MTEKTFEPWEVDTIEHESYVVVYVRCSDLHICECYGETYEVRQLNGRLIAAACNNYLEAAGGDLKRAVKLAEGGLLAKVVLDTLSESEAKDE